MNEKQTVPDTIIINTDSNTTSITKRIELFKLVSETDDCLKRPTEFFDFSNPPTDPTELASRLVETMKSSKGIGLSANQCGLPYRVFVMGTDDNVVAFFNPKIISFSDETVMSSEGCLSFPGLLLNVIRPSSINVEYQDYTGTIKQAHFTGLTARCFLHEYDHMQGVLFTEKVKPLSLKMAKQRRFKINQKYERLIKNARNTKQKRK